MPTSGILFNLYLDELTDVIKQGRTASLKVNGKEIFLIKYADDICLLDLSPAGLQISLGRLWKYASEYDLVVNTEKSYCMVFRGKKRPNTKVPMKLGNRDLVQVSEFKYLGNYFNEELSRNQSSKRILNNAFGAYSQLCQRIANLPNNCPFRVFETILDNTVIAVGSYGCEVFGPNEDLDALCIRALRFFFSLARKTPSDGLWIITGWVPPSIRQLMQQVGF